MGCSVAVATQRVLCRGRMTWGCRDWILWWVAGYWGVYSVCSVGAIGYFLTPLRGQLTRGVTWRARGSWDCFGDSALRASDMMGDISNRLMGWFLWERVILSSPSARMFGSVFVQGECVDNEGWYDGISGWYVCVGMFFCF
jgi:hypothetical protein